MLGGFFPDGSFPTNHWPTSGGGEPPPVVGGPYSIKTITLTKSKLTSVQLTKTSISNMVME